MQVNKRILGVIKIILTIAIAIGVSYDVYQLILIDGARYMTSILWTLVFLVALYNVKIERKEV